MLPSHIFSSFLYFACTDLYAHLLQALQLFYSSFHLAKEGVASEGISALTEELLKTQNVLLAAQTDLKKAEGDRVVMLS